MYSKVNKVINLSNKLLRNLKSVKIEKLSFRKSSNPLTFLTKNNQLLIVAMS